MTPEFLVDALKVQCRDTAVDDCVELFRSPPGRRPAPELVRLSAWFNALDEENQKFVVLAMAEAAHATLFGVLCVLDGVRVIETGEKSEFRLTAIRSGIESEISDGSTDLHDLLGAARCSITAE